MESMVSWNGAHYSCRPVVPSIQVPLTVSDHTRDSSGMTYVYPVVSRRAGGVSVGINLNPNNACNWRCMYCQVPNLRRGGPPPIDLDRLAVELDRMLDDIVSGDFMSHRVPEDQRRLIDIAFSGNGEPTSAAEFSGAVELAAAALARRGLASAVKLRLITNGSLLDRRQVRAGIARLGELGGEVWFKVDAATSAAVARINGVRMKMASVERRLRLCAGLCPTWVQTCLFELDRAPPAAGEIDALVAFLSACRQCLRGVFLYGLARPSAQAEAPRLGPVAPEWMDAVARRLRAAGLAVEIRP
jgi:wyosine [tRNA(Phe)-imidazoG37] synthetase (radical SAM superfamily)